MKTGHLSFIPRHTRHCLVTCLCILFAMHLGAQGITVTTKDVTCFGRNDGQATVSGGNGSQPYTCQWSHNPAYSATRVIDLPKGSHSVTVTDANGCTAVKSFEIEEPDPLNLTLRVIDYNADFCSNTFCVTVEAIASGGTPPYFYEPRTQTRCTPGAMIFLVIDANGCVKTAMTSFAEANSACRGSFDPNDIVGPSGFGDLQWMSSKARLNYMIRFENDALLATGPALYVEVRHDIDPLIAPLSLRLDDFGFGPYVFDVPANSSFYQQRLDLRDDLGIYLDVVAGLDPVQNQAFWQFESIDPATGLRPLDLTMGFLPPNDTLTGDGEGFVTFSVVPRVSTVTRDTVRADATIVFDQNEPITTNMWHNTLDALPPITVLDPLDDTIASQVIQLSWQGQDDPMGSGVAKYHLYSSLNGGNFTIAQSDISASNFNFQGTPGNRYAFIVVGVDQTGNTEVKSVADDTTYILPTKNLEISSPLSQSRCVGDSLEIDWDAVLVDSIDILLSLDSGMTFQTIFTDATNLNAPYLWPIPDTLNLTYAQVKLYSESDSIESIGPVFSIRTRPAVDAGPDVDICTNTITNLSASGANTYVWSPLYHIGLPNNATTSAYPDTTTTYYVQGTNVHGCQNIDSVVVSVYSVSLDTVTTELCDGDSLFVGGDYQTEAGFYTDELISSNGCDSTVVTEIIITGPCPFPSPVVYVDKDAMGLNNGTSWMDAFTDLQDALAAVEYYFNVNEIWVAEGDYLTDGTGDRMASFVLRDSVWIYGGFTGIETMREERLADPSLVLISGDIGIPGDSTDNAFHVFAVDQNCENCILDGMTVQFGQADFIFNEGYIGAGILNKGKLRLQACIVERNTSILDGAAIYNTGAFADITIKDCIFRLNTSALERDILNIDGAKIRFQGLNQIQE